MQDIQLAVLGKAIKKVSMHSEEQEFLTWVTSQLPYCQAEAEAWLATIKVNKHPYPCSLQDTVHQQLQQRGLSPVVLDREKAVLYAQKEGATSDTLLLYYHYDERTDDATVLLPLLASLAMYDLYHTRNRLLPITITWLIDGSGSRKFPIDVEGSASLAVDSILWLRAHQTAEAAPTLALGCKGYLSVTLSVETASSPLASSFGAIVPNAAWRLLWALSSLKAPNEEILIEGFYDTLVPADDQMLEELHTLPDPLPEHTNQSLPPFLLQLQGFQLHYAHLLLPTCSIISIESQAPELADESDPSMSALLPAQARAQIDFYLVPEQDPRDIFVKLQEHLQREGFADLLLQQRLTSYASRLTSTHPLVQSLQEAISQAHGKAPAILPLAAENFPIARSPEVPPLLVYTMSAMTIATENNALNAEGYISSIKQLLFFVERLGEEKNGNCSGHLQK